VKASLSTSPPKGLRESSAGGGGGGAGVGVAAAQVSAFVAKPWKAARKGAACAGTGLRGSADVDERDRSSDGGGSGGAPSTVTPEATPGRPSLPTPGGFTPGRFLTNTLDAVADGLLARGGSGSADASNVLKSESSLAHVSVAGSVEDTYSPRTGSVAN
jgi:hypothetical protein